MQGSHSSLGQTFLGIEQTVGAGLSALETEKVQIEKCID
jgi:hypothetical protein